uniref:hypothetical protein n=1 Tax=Escherichia coli TaxID=562 RepID=UPI003D815838
MNKTKGCLIANFATVPLEMAPLEIRHRSVRPISAKHAQASRFLQQSQLKLIRFTGESAIAFSLLSGQKVNGHIGLPA